jgi:hypothetical protein
MQSKAAALQPLGRIEQTVVLAFRIAHLLTANVAQSESAVMEAIDSFEPDLDSHEDLLRGTIRAAIQRPPSQLQAIDSFLPPELRPVLSLPTELRRCFVLRFLVRLPVPACARLLRFNAAAVNEGTCAALQRLAGLALVDGVQR